MVDGFNSTGVKIDPLFEDSKAKFDVGQKLNQLTDEFSDLTDFKVRFSMFSWKISTPALEISATCRS